jgi:assimilatory nitrate reductase catalytic subunit
VGAWLDEALTTMAARFPGRAGPFGASAVGVISTGQLVTEEFYTLGKLVQLGLGTPNYDGNTTLCMSTAVAGYKRSFGSDGPPGAYEDLEQADVILLIGANIAENHPILCRRLQSNPDATLVVVDRGYEDGHDGRPSPAGEAAVRLGAHQRPHSHHHRARPG